MNKLSVTVITLNEEKNLARCLDSVKDFADDLVIIDSGSTDDTIKIAETFGAKIFVRRFDNYSNQKNFAVSKTSGDWILSLDADEEVEHDLAEEIKLKIINSKTSGINQELKNNDPVSDLDAYSIPRKNIIFGKFIKYTRWQPELDRHVWIWRKGAGKWMGDVHEELVVKGRVGRMEYHKIHHQYDTIAQFWEMMNRYAEFEAKQKINNGFKFSLLRMFFDPKYNFFVRYFYRLGFLDGWRGFVLSYLMAVYHLIIWVKVWERTI